MQRMEQATTRKRHGGYFTEERPHSGAQHRGRETSAEEDGENER